MTRKYIESANGSAKFEKLEDGTFCGETPECPGTIAFGKALEVCRRELESALEDWLLSALRHDDILPVINGINLNARAGAERG